MQVTLECQTRPEDSKPRALRRQGLIPAALYGHKGAESVSLTVKAKDAENLLKKASVNNTLVDVNIPELPWNGKALIREVQSHPWKRTIYHLSFFSVAAQDTLDIVVPIHTVGEAPGVEEGGVLEQIMTELQVQCAPDKIPEVIEVDVSNMEMGASIHLHELDIPEGVTVMDDPERTIISIVAPAALAVEEEETTEEAELLGETEVEAEAETEAEAEA